MIGRVALLVTFKKAKPKPQSLSRSRIRDFGIMEMNKTIFLVLFFFTTQIKAQNNFEPCSDIFSQPLWLSENYMRTAADLMSQADSFHIEASILTDHSLTSSDNILELVQL